MSTEQKWLEVRKLREQMKADGADWVDVLSDTLGPQTVIEYLAWEYLQELEAEKKDGGFFEMVASGLCRLYFDPTKEPGGAGSFEDPIGLA